ncbi:hypothetical protein LJC22_01425 [Desulfosarcina sp. OttesenSCG-928-G10]|nr:hypothetical protein [Desulfosarcina sp. OttesenSCG-928-G10]
MSEYATFLTLRIHASTASGHWRILPDSATERFLAWQRLRVRFVDGTLDLWGEADIVPPPKPPFADDDASAFLSFYLFNASAHFTRLHDVPLFSPGKEILQIIVKPDTGAMDSQPPVITVIPLDPGRQKEVARGRKKYFGSVFVQPPVAQLVLPKVIRPAGLEMDLAIPARTVRVMYAVRPKPECDITLISDMAFHRMEPPDSENMVVFRSEHAVPMDVAGRCGPCLALIDGHGKTFPLLENLPVPGPDQIRWDASEKTYIAEIHIDLSRFGLIA